MHPLVKLKEALEQEQPRASTLKLERRLPVQLEPGEFEELAGAVRVVPKLGKDHPIVHQQLDYPPIQQFPVHFGTLCGIARVLFRECREWDE